MEKRNIALEIDKLVASIDSNYMGSDTVHNGENAFLWTFKIDGVKAKIIYQNN